MLIPIFQKKKAIISRIIIQTYDHTATGLNKIKRKGKTFGY